MLFNPTECNINPILFPARVRPMNELVLALTIHDKYVTIAKAAKVSFIVRTGLTPPSEKCGATKTHGNNELGITVLSKQRFVVAMPTNTRFPSPVKVLPSAHQGFIRGAIALHKPASSGQHRFQVCGLIAGALPVRIRTSTRGTTGDRPCCVVRSLPFPVSCCVKGRKKISP